MYIATHWRVINYTLFMGKLLQFTQVNCAEIKHIAGNFEEIYLFMFYLGYIKCLAIYQMYEKDSRI